MDGGMQKHAMSLPVGKPRQGNLNQLPRGLLGNKTGHRGVRTV